MVTEERRYYSIAEVARLLRVSRSTVWRWIAAGRLKAHRLGPKTLRITPEELQRLMQSTRHEGHRIFSSIEDLERFLETPLSAEELARRRELFERIKEARKHRVIAPLTAADLIHMARDEEYASYGFDR